MKTNLYRQLQRRLIIVFLIFTVLLSAVLLGIIAYISYRASFYSSQGMLVSTDFLYYYLHHQWEFNTFLLGAGFAILLLVFIILFFHSMNILLLTMKGEKIQKFPFFFRMFPEFTKAHQLVETMIQKRNDSRQVYEQEQTHKNELLMYLAHDLKTPLTSLIGYINHTMDHQLDEEGQATALKIASEKAERLDDLIDEFSEILRYDDKVSQLDLTQIDVYQLLQQQLNGFYPLMEKRHITLDATIPQGIMIIADYDKLFRLFDNLMRNAINYCIEHTFIHIRVIPNATFVELIYQNTSEKMDEETVKHLFDKFYRASTARTSTSGGAGLGLAIAKEIVELHHGSIEASIDGQDIVFTIRLPYRQEVNV